MTQLTSIPDDAARLLERGKVPLPEAIKFLGIGHTVAYPMAQRYLKRQAKLVAQVVSDAAAIGPRRDPKTGAWREIPCYQLGHKYMVRADLIVPMVYAEVPWPWSKGRAAA